MSMLACRWALVGCGFFATCGCSDDEGSSSPRKEAGERIAPGTEVVAGSELLGTAFPRRVGDRGVSYTAVLVVDGDPAIVFDEYARQLADHGIPVGPSYSDGACKQRPGSAHLDDEGFPLQCAASGLTLWHAPAESDSPWASHIVLQYTPAGDGEPVDVVLDTVGPEKSSLPDPGPEPQSPGVGEPVAPATLEPFANPIRVVSGMNLLAPAAPGQSVTGGYIAVARITGDPEEVLDAVFEQAVVQSDDSDRITDTIDGTNVEVAFAGGLGGASIALTVVQDPEGDWYLLIEVDND